MHYSITRLPLSARRVAAAVLECFDLEDKEDMNLSVLQHVRT